jgi:hypothetical protein
MPPPPPPTRNPKSSAVRTHHEQLLDACEEGNTEAVLRCLARPGVSAYLNSNGIARGIVRVFDDKGATLDWGHPELLACGRGDTALRFAAFHGYAKIVEALLEAGAIPGLRNDEANSALALAKAGLKMLSRKPGSKSDKLILPEDKPRCGDAAQQTEVIRLLEQAERQQWVIVDVHDRPYLNGRIGQRVRVMDDKVLVVVDDAEAGPHRPYYEKGAVRTAKLLPSQLKRLKPPPSPQKEWPLSQRWAWPAGAAEGGEVHEALAGDGGGPAPAAPEPDSGAAASSSTADLR